MRLLLLAIAAVMALGIQVQAEEGSIAMPAFADDFTHGTDHWVIDRWEEGEAVRVRAEDGKLKVDTTSKEHGVMLWLKQELPKNFTFEFDFTPLSKEGFFLLFFCARNRDGSDLLGAKALADRSSATLFKKYTNGPAECYHISFRRGEEANCNLRKNPGMNLLKQAQLAEVLPAGKLFHVKLTKQAGRITLEVGGKVFMDFTDDGKSNGGVLEGGRIGFRQVYESSALYQNVRLVEIK